MSGLCPCCGGVLTEGYLRSGGSMFFVKEKRVLLVNEKQGDFVLGHANVHFPALYCPQCKKLTVSLEAAGQEADRLKRAMRGEI